MAERGVHLAVHLLHASVSCLGDGHYGPCYCLCVRSAGITEVLELTSLGCRQQMHKMGFCPESLRVCSLSPVETGREHGAVLQGLPVLCVPPE